MSHHVNDLASSFVAMAAAYEQLPKVQADLASMEKYNDSLHETIQRLELKAIERNNEISGLRTQLSAMEAERDNALMQFLECDDAKTTLVRTLEIMARDIAGVLQAIAPVPEPQPVTVVPETMPLVDGSLTSPFEPKAEAGPSHEGLSSSADTPITEPEMDQSEPPFHPIPESNTATSMEAQSAPSAEKECASASNDGVSVSPPPTSATADPVSPTETSAPTASAPSTATPSANATSNDPEPAKYIPDGFHGMLTALNPAWVSWFNSHGAATQLG
jgi:hypothetical protein